MNYYLKNKDLEVTIASLGAEPISIKYCGQERLWQNDNNTWTRHAPILFPHGGKCSIVINGHHYPDQMHGFLRDQEFSLISLNKTAITLLLTSSSESKKTYPYDFKFYVTYQIKDNILTITYRIENPSEETIYFLLGTHESYALNDTVDHYYVEFNKDEKLDLMSDETGKFIYIKDKRKFSLDSPFLDNSDTIVLHNINSREITLKRSDGKKVVTITYPDFPNLMFWHPVGSKMICIEPWLNLTDTPLDKEKELKDKEHVISLKPHQAKIITRTITYFNNK